MQDATLKSALTALKEGASVSAARRIARVLPEIEAALSRGVSRELIRKALQDDGIDITANGFATALYRLRKSVRKSLPTLPCADKELVLQRARRSS